MHGKGTLSISRIERGFLFDIGLTPFGWKLIDQGKYVREWKDGERWNGERWNGTLYDKEEKIIGKFMNGWFDQ